jgi:DNA-binding NarL/FixJ family response regulator
VLVIDDDRASASLATRVLEGMDGVKVVATAPDAASALALASKLRPAAALVDVGLPDRDGIDLAYELASLPWRPRIVLMSTNRDAVSAIDARETGNALPFVPKDELSVGRLHRLLASD